MIKLNASSLDRVSACPGSFHAEMGIKPIDSPWSAEGNLLHDVMARKNNGNLLDREQKRVIEMCTETGAELVARYLGVEKPEFRREWVAVCTIGGIVILSQRIDFAGWAEKALVIDWKFGRASDIEAAETLQLRAAAIAAAREYQVSSVVVAIVQPYADRENRVSVSEYSVDDVFKAEQQIAEIGKRATEDAPRFTGDHCKYCKAVGTERCPESQAIARWLVQVDVATVLPSGVELANLLYQLTPAKAVIAAIVAHAKVEAAAGRLPGWTVTSGKRVRKIEDVVAAWDKLQYLMGAPEFMRSLKATVGGLETSYAAATNKKGKDLTESFNAALGSALGWEEQEGSLKKL